MEEREEGRGRFRRNEEVRRVEQQKALLAVPE
jgi:hypothetical protein